MIIRGNHRAYAGADTGILAFIRDESGRRDLSGMDDITVSAQLAHGKEVASFPATGDEEGRLSFTVTNEAIQRGMSPGVYALRAVADGEVIYTANLEVV